MEIGDIELENVEVVVGMWVLILAMIWFLPSMIGLKAWNISTGILVSVVSLPLTYFIINAVANK